MMMGMVGMVDPAPYYAVHPIVMTGVGVGVGMIGMTGVGMGVVGMMGVGMIGMMGVGVVGMMGMGVVGMMGMLVLVWAWVWVWLSLHPIAVHPTVMTGMVCWVCQPSAPYDCTV